MCSDREAQIPQEIFDIPEAITRTVKQAMAEEAGIIWLMRGKRPSQKPVVERKQTNEGISL